MKQEMKRRTAKTDRFAPQVTAKIARLVTSSALASLTTGHAYVQAKPISDLLVPSMLRVFVKSYKPHALHLSFETDTAAIAHRVGLDYGDLSRTFTSRVGATVQAAADYYAERIDAALKQISADQLTGRQARAAMRVAVTEMGLSPNNPSVIETLVRSHQMASFGAAQWKSDREMDKTGLITGYQYSAVMDDRTDDECSALEGLVFSVDDAAAYWPPLHFNCRCQMLSLTDPVTPDEIPPELLDAARDDDFHLDPRDLVE
jgi:SPP1 gp7 family putative phage head morphogenesis protein